MRPRHVLANLLNRLVLSTGEFKGKQPANASVDPRIDEQGRRLPFVMLPLPHECQRKLQNQQFLVDKPPPRAFERFAIGWKMDQGQGLGQRQQVVRRQEFRGEDLIQQRCVRLERAPHNAMHRALHEAIREGIDRQQPAGRRFLVAFDDLHLRMRHLPDQPVQFGFAQHKQFQADL